MNSRDRLANIELKKNIIDELAQLLKHHEGLRQLKEQRRREEVENLIGDSKPLEK
jgi:DNA-binding protein H-NS